MIGMSIYYDEYTQYTYIPNIRIYPIYVYTQYNYFETYLKIQIHYIILSQSV
jgi:hypothetical protein